MPYPDRILRLFDLCCERAGVLMALIRYLSLHLTLYEVPI